MKWFVFEDELVSGPFLTEIKISLSQGTYSENAMDLVKGPKSLVIRCSSGRTMLTNLSSKARTSLKLKIGTMPLMRNSYGPFTQKGLTPSN